MRQSARIAFATWCLEHLSSTRNRESLCGDLLEEIGTQKHPILWYWRQVLVAISIDGSTMCARHVLPLIFAAGWTTLYSPWRALSSRGLSMAVLQSGHSFTWPYATVEELAAGVLPAVVFVWVGFLLFTFLKPSPMRNDSPDLVLRGLSASVTVLLLATVALLCILRDGPLTVHPVLREDFYLTWPHHIASVPVAFSLLAALLFSAGKGGPSKRWKRLARFRKPVAQLLAFVGLLIVPPAGTAQAPRQPAATVQFVQVEQNVKLEVLDWGGSGRTLVLLAGMGNDAHVFDQFASELTSAFHVYGVTRRGFGASSKPAPTPQNYSADLLGDDVLSVIDQLHLQRPLLAGHSIAGEELSSLGTRHPERIAGLIYLDAAYGYALYDQTGGDWLLDMLDVKARLEAMESSQVKDEKQFMNDLAAKVTLLDKDLQSVNRDMAAMPTHLPAPPPPPPVFTAIQFGEQKYTRIEAPVLAIFAVPHNFDALFRDDSTHKAAMISNDLARTSRQIEALQAAVPNATIVHLPNADHFIFNSDRAATIQAIKAFAATLR